MRPVRTAARAMLAAIFVSSGANALSHPDRLVPHAKPLTDRIAPLLIKANEHLPTDTRTLVQINGAVQLAGGVLLMTRARRVAAVALAGSMVPTTLAGHPFWQYDNPAERAAHRSHFLKNVGLVGGLILAALDNDGRPGLPWRTQHLVRTANRAASDMADSAGKSVRRSVGTTKSKVAIARKTARVAARMPRLHDGRRSEA